jgi:hypothetical protein
MHGCSPLWHWLAGRPAGRAGIGLQPGRQIVLVAGIMPALSVLLRAPAMSHDEIIEMTRQWLEKAVIGLNLCPFAKSVYVKNQVRFVVSDAQHLDALLEQLDAELDLLAESDPEQIDTTLLICPTQWPEFEPFNDFLEIADRAVEEHGLEGVLQIASFHPQFQFADTEPDDISNFTNRAPFAILHLLREASIERAVAAFPDAAHIYERNIETLQKLGLAGWQALGFSDAAAEKKA